MDVRDMEHPQIALHRPAKQGQRREKQDERHPAFERLDSSGRALSLRVAGAPRSIIKFPPFLHSRLQTMMMHATAIDFEEPKKTSSIIKKVEIKLQKACTCV